MEEKEVKKVQHIIEVKNIKKSFSVGKNKVDVLKGVNLEINSGDFVIIIGPSGCGKTTLLNTLLGLEKPDEGQVLVFGNDIYSMSEDKRATFRLENFGVVRQQSDWVSSLNVADNIALPLGLAGFSPKEAKRKTRDILYLFRFDKFRKYNPKELSGGEEQKLSVCRALVSDPLVVLADEPTGSLDSITADDLMYDLKTLNVESKKTFVMVTHNPEYEKYATKFVYMEDGKIKKVKQKERLASDMTPAKNADNIVKRKSANRLYFLTKLAFQNFKRNRLRSILTSGGVALSIGFITFLIALSYGFQKFSNEGIKNIEAFRVIDVDTGKSTITSIDDDAIKKMSDIFGVEKVYPLISIAGDLKFGSQEVNGVVYGRDSETLKMERLKIIAGGTFTSDNANEMIINSVAARKLGIYNTQSAVGNELEINNIIRPELLGTQADDIKIEKKKYKIVGLTDEGEAPYAYVPLENLRATGIVNYSEAKVKTTSTDNIERIKSIIEHMGFKVASVKDTVDQANQFFGVFRLILTVFGIITVIVSCIGMFNTLTISLVEKTREIGIMKYLGATRKDVAQIFITEALIIGTIGGILGLVFSYFLGTLFNASIYTLAKTTGNTPIEIFIFSKELVVSAIIFSIILSVVIGLYPSRRAAKMNALNIFRYE